VGVGETVGVGVMVGVGVVVGVRVSVGVGVFVAVCVAVAVRVAVGGGVWVAVFDGGGGVVGLGSTARGSGPRQAARDRLNPEMNNSQSMDSFLVERGSMPTL
jgi:hypothetical protein